MICAYLHIYIPTYIYICVCMIIYAHTRWCSLHSHRSGFSGRWHRWWMSRCRTCQRGSPRNPPRPRAASPTSRPDAVSSGPWGGGEGGATSLGGSVNTAPIKVVMTWGWLGDGLLMFIMGFTHSLCTSSVISITDEHHVDSRAWPAKLPETGDVF